jgi:tellurite methyltransferase
MNGGYDDGYMQCDCFWGVDPGSYVKILGQKIKNFEGIKVLDAGCGEGKNAAFFAARGALVDAIDLSEAAIKNGRHQWPNLLGLRWHVADIITTSVPSGHYDIVIAYGLLHCLRDKNKVEHVIHKLQEATAYSGYNVVCAFNDRNQEMHAHPGFEPCLLNHREYLSAYSSWEIITESDSDLTEKHPHNNIEHTHSLTRLLARKILQ